MRRPPSVEAAVQLRHNEDATKLLRERERRANLQQLVVDEVEVALHRCGILQQIFGNIRIVHQKTTRGS